MSSTWTRPRSTASALATATSKVNVAASSVRRCSPSLSFATLMTKNITLHGSSISKLTVPLLGHVCDMRIQRYFSRGCCLASNSLRFSSIDVFPEKYSLNRAFCIIVGGFRLLETIVDCQAITSKCI